MNVFKRQAIAVSSRMAVLFLVGALMLGAAVPIVAAQTPEASSDDGLGWMSASAVPAGADFMLAIDGDPASDQQLQLDSLFAAAGLPADLTDMGMEMLAPGVDGSTTAQSPLLEGEIAVVVEDIRSMHSQDIDDFSIDDPASGLDFSSLDGPVVVLTPNVAGDLRSMLEEYLQSLGFQGEDNADSDFPTVTVVGKLSDFGLGPVFAIADGHVLVGHSVKQLRPFVQAANGLELSLADEDSFTQVREGLPTDALSVGYLKGQFDLEAVSNALDVMDIPLEIDDIVKPAMAHGFAVAVDPAGIRFETVSVSQDSEAPLSNRDASDLAFAESVPSSVLFAMNGFDLGDSFASQVMQRLLAAYIAQLNGDTTELQPVPENQIAQEFASLELLLGFNPLDDFISQLTGPYGFALFDVDLSGAALPSAVLVSQVADSSTVSSAITSLASDVQASSESDINVTTLNLDDATFTDIRFEYDGIDANVQLGVADNQMLIGLGNGLSNYTDATDQTLSEDERFQQAMSLLPQNYDGWSYVNLDGLASAISGFADEMFGDDQMDGFGIASASPVGSSAGSDVSGLGPLVTVSWKDGAAAHTSSILLIGYDAA